MKSVFDIFWKFKWQWMALSIIGAAILSSRGGAAALLGVGRFLIPVLVVLVVFQILKKTVFSQFQDIFKEKIKEAMKNAEQARGETINLKRDASGTYRKS